MTLSCQLCNDFTFWEEKSVRLTVLQTKSFRGIGFGKICKLAGPSFLGVGKVLCQYQSPFRQRQTCNISFQSDVRRRKVGARDWAQLWPPCPSSPSPSSKNVVREFAANSRKPQAKLDLSAFRMLSYSHCSRQKRAVRVAVQQSKTRQDCVLYITEPPKQDLQRLSFFPFQLSFLQSQTNQSKSENPCKKFELHQKPSADLSCTGERVNGKKQRETVTCFGQQSSWRTGTVVVITLTPLSLSLRNWGYCDQSRVPSCRVSLVEAGQWGKCKQQLQLTHRNMSEGKHAGKLYVISAVKVATSGSEELSLLPLGSLFGYLIR